MKSYDKAEIEAIVKKLSKINDIADMLKSAETFENLISSLAISKENINAILENIQKEHPEFMEAVLQCKNQEN